MPILLPAGILLEGNIQAPMLAVLDPPMLADGVAQGPGFDAVAADVQPRLPRLHPGAEAAARQDRQRAQVFPDRTSRMVRRDFDGPAMARLLAPVARLTRLMRHVPHPAE